MSNSKYRCQGCKNFYPQPPYRRVGLGGVCSEECIGTAKAKPNSTTRTQPRNVDEPSAKTVAELYVRDMARCRFCGRQGRPGDRLHKHHIHYRSEGVDHSLENLILLCDTDHDKVHSDKGRWQPVCLTYIWALATGGPRLYLPAIDRMLKEAS